MRDGEDSVARNSIRRAVCQYCFSGDGNCSSCHSQPECGLMVDETLGLVSELARKRKLNPVKNGG